MLKQRKNTLIGKPWGLEPLRGETTLSRLRTEEKYR